MYLLCQSHSFLVRVVGTVGIIIVDFYWRVQSTGLSIGKLIGCFELWKILILTEPVSCFAMVPKRENEQVGCVLPFSEYSFFPVRNLH